MERFLLVIITLLVLGTLFSLVLTTALDSRLAGYMLLAHISILGTILILLVFKSTWDSL